jgi:predicted transposase YbfD/YdcC
MPSLITILRQVPDPRTGNAQRHALLDLPVIALATLVCGAGRCVGFAGDREDFLREFLSLENGLPSHDTFSRLFRLPDPQAFGRAFGAVLEDLGTDGLGVLAIDGKTLRRSFDPAAGRSPLPVVTASGAGARLAIGPSAVPQGGNGITAARALLETLSLDGGVGDRRCGLHLQSDTAALILKRCGDYRFALKGTPLMRGVAEHHASPPGKRTQFQTGDADHGRIGTGVHRLSHEVDWLFPDHRYKDEPRLPGLAMIACVQSSRQTGESLTTASRLYVSSARLTPDAFATALPAHWSVETRLHRVPAMSFDEDRARTRTDNSPENLSILRHPPLTNLRKARPKRPVSRNRKHAGWSDHFAKPILGQMR